MKTKNILLIITFILSAFSINAYSAGNCKCVWQEANRGGGVVIYDDFARNAQACTQVCGSVCQANRTAKRDPSTPCNASYTEGGYIHCGDHWTGWHGVGGGVGNPCPGGCPLRGDEIGKDYRSVGILPPRPQQKVKFRCYKKP